MITRQALAVFSLQPSVFYYTPKPNEDQLVQEELKTLANLHNRWGFWMMHHYLRNHQFKWNHKKVYRINMVIWRDLTEVLGKKF